MLPSERGNSLQQTPRIGPAGRAASRPKAPPRSQKMGFSGMRAGDGAGRGARSTPCTGCHQGMMCRAKDARRPCPAWSPHLRLVYCVYQSGGCMEKPNCPALLVSPGDEGEATNSFVDLLRYLISANCRREERGKEQDRAVMEGRGRGWWKREGRKGWGGRGKSSGWGGGKGRGEQGNDGCKQKKKKRRKKMEKSRQTKNRSQKQREGRRDKRAARCQAPRSSQGRKAGGDNASGPVPAPMSWVALGVVGTRGGVTPPKQRLWSH